MDLKVVIIDNHDSFTYNLAHYINQFVNCVDVFRADKINLEDISYYDKILLSPGPGIPNEHLLLEDIIDRYFDSKSILGICLGHQAIAEYFNGKLENLNVVKHGISSTIYQQRNCSIFNNLPVSFKVGHYHSWTVSKDNFPDCLEITSINSEGIITSFKHKYFNIKGLQFHPESILTEYGLELIGNWVVN